MVFFPVQCWLELLAQHWTRILPVRCSVNNIKPTLNRNFACAVLPRTSWKTQHKDCTCAMLFQEYQDNIQQEFSMWNIVQSLSDNKSRVQCCCKGIKTSMNRFFHVQCYPKSIKTTLKKNFLCGMLSGSSWTRLHKVFTSAMLSQFY